MIYLFLIIIYFVVRKYFPDIFIIVCLLDFIAVLLTIIVIAGAGISKADGTAALSFVLTLILFIDTFINFLKNTHHEN